MRDTDLDAASNRESLAPGKLSALLAELARSPEVSVETAWNGALRCGATVGRFELVREIGRGGFGVVWEAKDRELGRAVAFKALQARSAAAAEDRLLREAEAAARLSHPNIVTLHDVGRSEHGAYLILELLRGRTLASRLSEGPLPTGEAIRIATEIAAGLAHAHVHGVVHRDLTTGNVFLCDDGRVKILDLGMAHAFGRRKLEGGTPAYMAPEQWSGAPEDERTDVFALGVVLFRMLTGELPFGRGGVGRARPAPALDVPAEPALAALVDRMLALDALQRPRSAEEVLPALLALRRDLPDGAGAAPIVRTRRRAPRKGVLVALGIAAVAALAAGAAWIRLADAPGDEAVRRVAETSPGPRSIAVLPFADLSPERDREYFTDGISEEIINSLSSVKGLRVTGRTSSFSLKGKGDDLRAVGAKLGVDRVLEGSVRKEGSRVRITARLVDTRDAFQVWSQTYDLELTDVFAVQSDIARAVVAALDVRDDRGAASAPRKRPTTTPAAYDHYLLGMRALGQYHSGAEQARRSFEEALRLDPGYAPAWAGLANALNVELTTVRGGGDARAELTRRARDAADRAIALAPEIPDGYEARAVVNYLFLWDFQAALQDLERALALEPERPAALRRYGFVLGLLGDNEKLVAYLRKSAELDPLNVATWTTLGYTYAGSRQPACRALAREATNRAIALDPGAGLALWNLGEFELLDGNPAEALAIWERQSFRRRLLLGRVIAHHDLGDEQKSLEALAELRREIGDGDPSHLAVAHAWRGEVDPAVALLERMYEMRSVGIWEAAAGDPMFRKLHADPRFVALMARVALEQRKPAGATLRATPIPCE